jgi:hypothetical protein
MIALVAVFAALAAGFSVSNARYTEPWAQDSRLAAGGEVEVDDTYSDVKVEAGAPGVVHISAVKRADSQPGLADINIHVDTIEGAVKIVTDYPSGWRGFHRTQQSVDYRVHVPPGTKIVLRLKYGDGSIAGVGGPVDVQTRYGDATVADARGNADISSVYGDVALSIVRADPAQHISMRTTYGSVNVDLPASAKPHVHALTRMGSIDNDFDASGGQGPRLELRTTFGDVTVRRESNS